MNAQDIFNENGDLNVSYFSDILPKKIHWKYFAQEIHHNLDFIII